VETRVATVKRIRGKHVHGGHAQPLHHQQHPPLHTRCPCGTLGVNGPLAPDHVAAVLHQELESARKISLGTHVSVLENKRKCATCVNVSRQQCNQQPQQQHQFQMKSGGNGARGHIALVLADLEPASGKGHVKVRIINHVRVKHGKVNDAMKQFVQQQHKQQQL